MYAWEVQPAVCTSVKMMVGAGGSEVTKGSHGQHAPSSSPFPPAIQEARSLQLDAEKGQHVGRQPEKNGQASSPVTQPWGELFAVIYVSFWCLHGFLDGLRNVTHCSGYVRQCVSCIFTL